MICFGDEDDDFHSSDLAIEHYRPDASRCLVSTCPVAKHSSLKTSAFCSREIELMFEPMNSFCLACALCALGCCGEVAFVGMLHIQAHSFVVTSLSPVTWRQLLNVHPLCRMQS